ncbi:PHP domain-containing protein [Limisalsivibrio acetivorans]|uniref:PHP domain-containing protein n=1 Tax=Limisalsivibrio acetivorans TaxID=1304888 RepID=UPI0003B65578|nr:PHP domain-containing protein [Limisalsivibrio acetivorans]
MIDLHCHSVYSDGTYTPTQLIEHAERIGLKVLALTDHDTVSGLPQFFAAKTGIERVAGTELSIDYNKGTFHLVGLFLNHTDEKLLKTLDSLLEERRRRNEIMIRLTGELVGRELSMEELSGDSRGELGRPHIAKFLIREGIVKDTDEAFDKYLGKGKPLYRDKRRLSFDEGAELIHGAGGVAVLAHPLSLKLDRDEYEPFIGDLKDRGLDAVEAYCSMHQYQDMVFFGDIARKLELPVSAGSDFHGTNKPGVKLGKGRGDLKEPMRIYDTLKDLSLRYG